MMSARSTSPRRFAKTTLLALALAGAGFLQHASPSLAETSCNPDLLCALSGRVTFTPEATSSTRSLRSDQKKYRRKKKVPVTFIVAEGRASVFINGVYEGNTPTDPIALRPGRHDVQLRDRDTIVAQGVIRVSTRSDEAVLKVRHPSARPSARPTEQPGPPPAPDAN